MAPIFEQVVRELEVGRDRIQEELLVTAQVRPTGPKDSRQNLAMTNPNVKLSRNLYS